MNVRSPLTLPALAALALLCVSPLHAVTLEDDLLHWWLMGEQASATGGNPGGDVVSILAHDGHGPDLLIQGTLDEQPGNPFDPYPFQDNLANNHTNGSHFLVGAEASLDLSGDFTYSLWARQTGGGQWLKMFQHRTASGFAQAEIDNAGAIVWNVRINGNNSEIHSSSFLGDGNWHHLALWRQGGTVGAYIDGTDIGLGNFGEQQLLGAGDMLTGTSGFAVGAEVNGNAAFPGQVDDFRIYNAALSMADAAAIYNNGMGDFSDPDAPVTREDDIAAWWLLGEEKGMENVDPGGPTDLQSIPNQIVAAVPLEATAVPKLVDGVQTFEPFSFGDSKATEFSQGNHLVAPADTSLDLGNEDFSISLWARTPNGNGGQFNKVFQRIGAGFFQAETDGEGGIIWNIRTNGNAEISTEAVFTDNSWHHLVLTRNGALNELQAFKNGVLLGQGPYPNAGAPNDLTDPLNNLGPLGVGAEANGANAFLGQIDDLRIYGVALSAEDALAIYNEGKGDFAPPVPLQLIVTYASGSDEVTIEWESNPGKVYNLRSVEDPEANPDPPTWPIFNHDGTLYENLLATPPTNMVTFTLPAEETRFFVVEELPAPPFYVADFAGGDAQGWTTSAGAGDSGNTTWGLSTGDGLGPATGPPGSDDFWITNPDATYGTGSSIFLTSPPIDMDVPGAASATLSFDYWDDLDGLDNPPNDFAVVRIRNTADNSQIGTDIFFGDFLQTWETHTEDITAALGSEIVIECEFSSNVDANAFLGIAFANFEIEVE